MAHIFVLGAGGWGIAMTTTLARHGHNVTIWSTFEKEVELLKEFRCNESLLPGIIIPDSVEITNDISKAKENEILVIAVPSVAVRSVAAQLKAFAEDKIIVNLAKGFDDTSMKRLSVAIKEELPKNKVVVLSGPSHAEEVALDIPTLCVVAGEYNEATEYIRDIFTTSNFRLYSSDDVVSVELGGAIKNVMAIAVGIIDGMGLGDNTRAAIMTRGIAEMTKLSLALGGKAETLLGLAGVGDLIVTCTSAHSRNHEAGYYIGKGLSPEAAIKKVGKTVEGYITTRTVYSLIQKKQIDAPILKGVYNILYNGLSPQELMTYLMSRTPKPEF